MEFVRRKSAAPRACVTPEPAGCYGECHRRSLVKSFHAHEKEFWRSQQQRQLEKLDGMYQQYKQSSRKGNKVVRDVTATWTPRPYLCYSPANYDSEYSGRTLSPGQLAKPGSRTPTQATNLTHRSNLVSCGPISPRPGSPLEDEDMLKEALVAARNVMEDLKPIHPMMSMSGSSVQSNSDCRPTSRNLQESMNNMGATGGLQWEEDSFYGSDSPRSNYSSRQVKSPINRDYAADLRLEHARLQEKYDSYHAKLYKSTEANRQAPNPNVSHISNETSIRNSRKEKQTVLDCLQAVTPTAKLLQGPYYRSVNGVIEQTSAHTRKKKYPADAQSPGRGASSRVIKQEKTPVRQVACNVQSNKPDAAGKTKTPFGPPKRLVPATSKRYEAGLAHRQYNKGGSPPFGSAQRLSDSKSGSGGSMRTPRDESTSSKPRTPLSQNRVDMHRVSSKARRAPSYSGL